MPKFSWILLARIAFGECFLHSSSQLLTKKGRFSQLGLRRKCQGWPEFRDLSAISASEISLLFQLITCNRASEIEKHFVHLHFGRDVRGKSIDKDRYPGSIIPHIQVINPFSCLISLPVTLSPLLHSSTSFSLSTFSMLSFLHNAVKIITCFSSPHLCSQTTKTSQSNSYMCNSFLIETIWAISELPSLLRLYPYPKFPLCSPSRRRKF